MLRGAEIESLVELLEIRCVSLFHACQLSDFQSYLKLGGIPSRAWLEENMQPFTEFETDKEDHDRGVWDKVFLNFVDFGRTFAKGGKCPPNAYGPILLQVAPQVLREAVDVAVCFQPVGWSNYNREVCSLKSAEDIDKLFTHPIEQGPPESTWTKYKKALQEEFQCYPVCDPDISCTVDYGVLPLKYVKHILVDPYLITREKTLQAVVRNSIYQSNLQIQVRERYASSRGLYNELANIISKGVPSCRSIYQNPSVSRELKEWIQVIEDQGLEYQLRRFATYLRNGTLLHFT